MDVKKILYVLLDEKSIEDFKSTYPHSHIIENIDEFYNELDNDETKIIYTTQIYALKYAQENFNHIGAFSSHFKNSCIEIWPNTEKWTTKDVKEGHDLIKLFYHGWYREHFIINDEDKYDIDIINKDDGTADIFKHKKKTKKI